MKQTMWAMTCVAAAALWLTGCASTPTVREVALDRAPITSKLEPQDVRRTVEKMAESLLSAPGVREAVGGTRPVLDVEPLKNRTTIVKVASNKNGIMSMSNVKKFAERSTPGA